MTPDELYATTVAGGPVILALTGLPMILIAVVLATVVLRPSQGLLNRKKTRLLLGVGGVATAALMAVAGSNVAASTKETATEEAIEYYQDAYGLNLTASQIKQIGSQPGTTTTLLVETGHGAHRSYAFELIDTRVVPLMQVGDVWEPMPYALNADPNAGDAENAQEEATDD